jgi:hypothetical protein
MPAGFTWALPHSQRRMGKFGLAEVEAGSGEMLVAAAEKRPSHERWERAGNETILAGL